MQTHEGTKLLTDGFPWSMNALAYWSTRKRQCKQRLGQEGSQQIEKQKGRPWMKITESLSLDSRLHQRIKWSREWIWSSGETLCGSLQCHSFELWYRAFLLQAPWMRARRIWSHRASTLYCYVCSSCSFCIYLPFVF